MWENFLLNQIRCFTTDWQVFPTKTCEVGKGNDMVQLKGGLVAGNKVTPFVKSNCLFLISNTGVICKDTNFKRNHVSCSPGFLFVASDLLSNRIASILTGDFLTAKK